MGSNQLALHSCVVVLVLTILSVYCTCTNDKDVQIFIYFVFFFISYFIGGNITHPFSITLGLKRFLIDQKEAQLNLCITKS